MLFKDVASASMRLSAAVAAKFPVGLIVATFLFLPLITLSQAFIERLARLIPFKYRNITRTDEGRCWYCCFFIRVSQYLHYNFWQPNAELCNHSNPYTYQVRYIILYRRNYIIFAMNIRRPTIQEQCNNKLVTFHSSAMQRCAGTLSIYIR